MRIAFFGGTFDPPHCGHIAIARAAIRRLALDQVLVAPVGTQPLKGGSAHSSFEDRLAMVRLAVAGEPGLIASSVDAPLANGQPNYTFDTLQRLHSQLQPTDTLFCLLGADSFLTLEWWHRCAELLVFCNFIVAGRPGFSLQDVHAALPPGVENTCERREAGYTRLTLSGPSDRSSELFLLPDLDQDISATEIRAAMAEGSTPQTVLPSAVAEYIRSHGLYRQVEIP
ncbi:MAG: nicotinate (nicotinamide) nucleotide adenylyltransferase [Acidobacteriaceae bacterium]